MDYGPLKKALGLPESERYFTPEVIRTNTAFQKLIRDVMAKSRRRERLDESEKRAAAVQNQRGLLEGIVTGQALNILPNPAGMDQNWFSLAQLAEPGNGLPYTPAQKEKVSQGIKGLLDAYVARDGLSVKLWNDSASELSEMVRTGLAPGQYPSMGQMEREIHYNHLRPFRWAWILYTLAFVSLLFFIVGKSRVASYLGAAAIVSAFSLHAYGFILRCLIAGRPPVTNMYESVIWVTWGCVLFSLIIWSAYRNAVIPTAATVFAIVGLVLADNLPAALDPNINPLEPVLRSNYWLTIHVLTITMSYAAFALSLCLGNVVLGNYLWRPEKTHVIQQFSLFMYRAMQIGVILLAAGTILGGVWADYSWGRFWGWDPKEVWALIALLLYLAVLHGRFTGWLKGFGFVATTVVAFLGVLMAWYGVNFVLGVGLHSYGFGTGGMGYVLAYVGAQIGFIVAAYIRYNKANAGKPLDTAIFPRGRTSPTP